MILKQHAPASESAKQLKRNLAQHVREKDGAALGLLRAKIVAPRGDADTACLQRDRRAVAPWSRCASASAKSALN